MSAGSAADESRAHGYTVAAKTEFASLDDMRYYDEVCPAHKVLKAAAKAAGLASRNSSTRPASPAQGTLG